MCELTKLRYFKVNVKAFDIDLTRVNDFALTATKFPNDFNAVDFLKNSRHFGAEVGNFLTDWNLNDENASSCEVASDYFEVIKSMMKKHDAYNQKNVKLDYYRSKINAIKNNANVLTSLGAKFEQEIESITNFREDFEKSAEKEIDNFHEKLRNSVLDAFFDFKFDVDLEQHHLQFILNNNQHPNTDFVYLKCRFLQKFEPKMIYMILDVFYRQRTNHQIEAPFNSKQFIELANSQSDSIKFFV